MVILVLLCISLLVAGCGGGGGEASSGNAPAVTDQAGTTSATAETGQTTTQAGTPSGTLTIDNSAGERVPVRVEVVSTPADMERGLMGRTSLAEDAGMLFVFSQEQSTDSSFWMKDTLIPLSIAFIDPQGRIIDIQDMQPLDESPHYPAAPYQYALEVNQGFFANHGIDVGNALERPS